MTRKETKVQWDEARALAVRYVDATYHLPADKVREANPRLPFLFEAALPGKGAVLIHNGAVLESHGTEALGAYLDAIDVYADRALTAEDVLALIYLFDVFPPVDPLTTSPRNYVTDEGTDLSKRSVWKGNELDFTLAYRLQPGSVPGRDIGGTVNEGEGVMTIAFWTLHLRKGVVPRWTEERREKTYTIEHFDDE